MSDNSSGRAENNKEQREKLGVSMGKNQSRTPPSEPSGAMQKVEVRSSAAIIYHYLKHYHGFKFNQYVRMFNSLRRKSKMMHSQI